MHSGICQALHAFTPSGKLQMFNISIHLQGQGQQKFYKVKVSSRWYEGMEWNLPLTITKIIAPLLYLPYGSLSGHEGVAVLLPGFAIKW